MGEQRARQERRGELGAVGERADDLARLPRRSARSAGPRGRPPRARRAPRAMASRSRGGQSEAGFHGGRGVLRRGRGCPACCRQDLPLSYPPVFAGGRRVARVCAWQDTASGLTSSAARARWLRKRATPPARPAREGLQSVRYEGYGPGGAAVMVECVTPMSRARAGKVRRAFAQHGGKLGARRLGELPVQYRGSHDLPARHGRGGADARGARGGRRGRGAERGSHRSRCWRTRWSSPPCARCSPTAASPRRRRK